MSGWFPNFSLLLFPLCYYSHMMLNDCFFFWFAQTLIYFLYYFVFNYSIIYFSLILITGYLYFMLNHLTAQIVCLYLIKVLHKKYLGFWMILRFLKLLSKSYLIFVLIRSDSYSLILFMFIKKNCFLYISDLSQFLCNSILMFEILFSFIDHKYFAISDLRKMIKQVQLSQY